VCSGDGILGAIYIYVNFQKVKALFLDAYKNVRRSFRVYKLN
jgi:hypothetical protein